MKHFKGRGGATKKTGFFLLLSIFSLMLCSGLVYAQDDASSDDAFTLEEIVVTGSRIRTSGMETPTPVTVVEMQEVDVMSPEALVDGLADLPQFYASNTTQTPGAFFTSAGSGNLNLRGLNQKRTLQLLDGRRVVPSTIFGGPDINLFPEFLLRSVETVTGGASAAYGTDAVSGVVNFILNTDYEGIKGKIQYGVTEKGHGENSQFAIAGGFDLKNGAHILFSAEKNKQDPIWGTDIFDYDWYDGWNLIENPDTANRGTTQDNPFYLPARQVRSINSSLDGIFHIAGSRYILDKDANVSPFVLGDLCNSDGCSMANGGSNNGDYNDPIAVNPGGQISPLNSRENYYGYIDYDVTSKLRVYGQAILGRNESTSKNFGGLFPRWYLPFLDRSFTIYSGNPFLPDEIQQMMDDQGLTSVRFGRLGAAEDLNYDAYTTQTTETVSLTAGGDYNVTGGYFDGWQVKSYYQYGETDVNAIQRGGIRLDRVYLAADVVTDPATGLPACNVTVTSGLYPDCVPLNLFGRGNASPEAVGWVTGFEPGEQMVAHGFLTADTFIPHTYVSDINKQRVINILQHVFEISADGDIYEGWGAGPLKMSLGYNYRTESFEQVVEVGPGGNINADPRYRPVMANNAALGIRGVPGGNMASGNSVEIQFSNVPFAMGSQDVHEAFGEVLVPIIADIPFVQQLNFSGAYRWAKYSGSGDIDSWKGGVDWTVFSDLRLRGTISRDVRAATIGEKFDRTGGLGNVTDYGIDPAGGNSYSITIFSNGSPDIQPEKATTQTAGFVYRPSWLSGLSVALDWYNIKVEDNINQTTAGEVVRKCYQENDQFLCSLITRGGDPTTDVDGNPINYISLVGVPYYNQESTKGEGVDFEISYNRSVDWFGGGETVGLRFLGSYLKERSSTNVSGVTADVVGWLYPEWTANLYANYRRGPLGLNFQARYVDDLLINNNWNYNGTSTRWDVFDNTVDSEILVNARVNYRFDFENWNMTLFLNVNNLFNKGPQRVLTGAYRSFFGNDTGTGVRGDLRGRRFVFGMNFEF